MLGQANLGNRCGKVYIGSRQSREIGLEKVYIGSRQSGKIGLEKHTFGSGQSGE